MASVKDYHYIDVQEALNKQVDKTFSDTNRYRAGLFLQPAARTPELCNLKSLGLSRLTIALIVAEVILYGNERDKNIVRELFQPAEVSDCIKFADETVTAKAARINADRVIHASDVFEPGDEIYELDHESPSNKFNFHALRR